MTSTSYGGPRRIAFVEPDPKTVQLPRGHFANVVEAIREQVRHDVFPAWQADLGGMPEIESCSRDEAEARWNSGYALIIVDNFQPDPAGAVITPPPKNVTGMGVHLQQESRQQPFALVHVDRHDQHGEWTVTASHECLEMLLNPDDKQLVDKWPSPLRGSRIEDTQGQVRQAADLGFGNEVQVYREICDPVQSDAFAYRRGRHGVRVSDFVLPSYYHIPHSSSPYDQQQRLSAGQQQRLSAGQLVPEGGMVSWREQSRGQRAPGFAFDEYALINHDKTLYLLGLGQPCKLLGKVR